MPCGSERTVACIGAGVSGRLLSRVSLLAVCSLDARSKVHPSSGAHDGAISVMPWSLNSHGRRCWPRLLLLPSGDACLAA